MYGSLEVLGCPFVTSASMGYRCVPIGGCPVLSYDRVGSLSTFNEL